MSVTLDYSARVIADSLSDDGHRLTTIEATYPRMVHSELMTHRWFSRNAASSRAIPVTKSIERVELSPAYPVHWGQEIKGMQPGAELPPTLLAEVKATWDKAREDALFHAARLVDYGLHKSLVNRIIEPWSWITTIVSSTDWENFFAQRATSRTILAQPELARIADLMEVALDASRPDSLADGYGWHLPYIDDADFEAAEEPARQTGEPLHTATMRLLCQVSVARCARVSLLNHDGTRELAADVGLYDKLVSATPMHASPLEHVACPASWNSQRVPIIDYRDGIPRLVGQRTVPLIGNFLGYAQLRHMVEETRDEETRVA